MLHFGVKQMMHSGYKTKGKTSPDPKSKRDALHQISVTIKFETSLLQNSTSHEQGQVSVWKMCGIWRKLQVCRGAISSAGVQAQVKPMRERFLWVWTGHRTTCHCLHLRPTVKEFNQTTKKPQLIRWDAHLEKCGAHSKKNLNLPLLINIC